MQLLEKYIEVSSSLPTELKQLILTSSLSKVPNFLENHKLFTENGLLEKIGYRTDVSYTLVDCGLSTLKSKTLNIRRREEATPHNEFFNLMGLKRLYIQDYGKNIETLEAAIVIAEDVVLCDQGYLHIYHNDMNEGIGVFRTIGKHITKFKGLHDLEAMRFLINNNTIFGRLRHVGISAFSKHINEEFVSRVLKINELFPNVSLSFSGEIRFICSNLWYLLVDSGVDMFLKGVTSSSGYYLEDTISDTIAQHTIEGLSFQDCESYYVEAIEFASRFARLKYLQLVMRFSELKNFNVKSTTLETITIHAKSIISCNFSGLKGLSMLSITGALDTVSFNSIPTSVTYLSVYDNNDKPTLRNCLHLDKEHGVSCHNIDKQNKFKNAPKYLKQFFVASPNFCFNLNLSNCEHLKVVTLFADSINSTKTEFWNSLPISLERIVIRFRSLHSITYPSFVAFLNGKQDSLELSIVGNVFVVLSSITGKPDYKKDEARTIGKNSGKPYCIIYNMSSSTRISRTTFGERNESESTSISCTRKDRRRLFKTVEKSDSDYRGQKMVYSFRDKKTWTSKESLNYCMILILGMLGLYRILGL